jgi:hypothetical protein
MGLRGLVVRVDESAEDGCSPDAARGRRAVGTRCDPCLRSVLPGDGRPVCKPTRFMSGQLVCVWGGSWPESAPRELGMIPLVSVPLVVVRRCLTGRWGSRCRSKPRSGHAPPRPGGASHCGRRHRGLVAEPGRVDSSAADRSRPAPAHPTGRHGCGAAVLGGRLLLTDEGRWVGRQLAARRRLGRRGRAADAVGVAGASWGSRDSGAALLAPLTAVGGQGWLSGNAARRGAQPCPEGRQSRSQVAGRTARGWGGRR